MTQQIEIQQTPKGHTIIHLPQFDTQQLIQHFSTQGKEIQYLFTYVNRDIYYSGGNYVSFSRGPVGNLVVEMVNGIEDWVFFLTEGDDGCYYLDEDGALQLRIKDGQWVYD